MSNDYPLTVTLDFPADSARAKAIKDEVFPSRSRTGTRTNYGAPDDDLNLTRELKTQLKHAIGNRFVMKSMLDPDAAVDDDRQPGHAVGLGTIRKVEATRERVKVQIQFTDHG